METAARYVALLVVLTIPATMLFWFLIHPLVRLWRRMKLRPWQYYLLVTLSLFCNYLAVWILLALFVPAIYGVVLLEERELKQRFGRQYEQYCRDVPRFVPRLRRR